MYSFGILLWCAFTQRVPFANENPNCIGRIVLSEKRRPEYTMSELARIPQDIDLIQLMISCWQKQGSDRPTIDKVRNQTNIMYHTMKAYTGAVSISWKSYLKKYRKKKNSKKESPFSIENSGETKDKIGIRPTEVEMVVVNGDEKEE